MNEKTGKKIYLEELMNGHLIRAYDLSASDSLKVVNILAAGITKSKLQIEDLRTAFNYMAVKELEKRNKIFVHGAIGGLLCQTCIHL